VSSSGTDPSATTLREYASVVWRRRAVVIACLIGVPIVAVGVSSLQSAQYTASADVLIRMENLAATLSGIPDTTAGGDPARLLETQARLARTPDVAAAALKATGGGVSATDFLDSSSVSPNPNADILTFTVTAASPEAAIRLVNSYAAAYARYRTSLDVGPVKQALGTVNTRLAALRVAGETKLPLYETLLEKQQELVSIRALRSQSAVLIDPATTAPKTQPRLKFAGLAGALAGLLVGIALALTREAIENRPRSSTELQEQLGLRVLGRLPFTKKGGTGLAVIERPDSVDAEAYRLLRANFDYAAAGFDGRVFAVTSLVEGEGKSTIASNLAIALARVGRKVILVDCDPLRPVLSARFQISRPSVGVFDVAIGRASLEAALCWVSVDNPTTLGNAGGALPLHADQKTPGRQGTVDLKRHLARQPKAGPVGTLRVLPALPASAEASDHMVSTQLGGLLARLHDEADIVIVDSAPLTTSVGMGVGRLVDGLIVVSNMSILRRPMIRRLATLLKELDAAKLGLVLTGDDDDPSAEYGYGYGYDGEVPRPEAGSNRHTTASPTRGVSSVS
jgi:succinoglycan biosynthesis transport protein ExoP